MRKVIGAAVVSLAFALPAMAAGKGKQRQPEVTTIERRELAQMQDLLAHQQRQLDVREAEIRMLRKGGAAPAGSGVGGAGMAGAPTGNLYSGTLWSVSFEAKEIGLRVAPDHVMLFPISQKTEAYRNGRRVPLESIRPGTPVRVSLPLSAQKDHGRRAIEQIVVEQTPPKAK